MMGATFPALVRHFTRSSALGQAFGRLYFANTMGAVAGTLLAGLILIELFGLSGALRIEGKGELAQVLTASPIRYVGPIVWGGSGSMTFAVR